MTKKAVSASDDNKIIPDVEITEAEYYKNPLVADVKYWGHWVLEKNLSGDRLSFFRSDEAARSG